MEDLTVSNDIDNFMQSADKAAARTALGVPAAADISNVDNTSDADKPVSTAQQAALDTEAATRLAADNRRAFAGGVAFDDGYAEVGDSSDLFALSNGPFTFLFNFSINTIGSQQTLIAKGGFTGGYFIGVDSDGSLFLFAKQDDSTGNYHLIKTNDAVVAGQQYSASIILDLDSSSIATFYLNGVAQSTTIVFNKLGIYGDASGEPLSLGARTQNNSNYIGGSIRDATIFNRALSAAAVAELSEIGLGAWLAVHPEDQWGGEMAGDSFSYVSATDNGSASVTKFDFTTTNNLGRQGIKFETPLKSGQVVRVVISNFSASAGSNIKLRIIDGNNLSSAANYQLDISADGVYDLITSTPIASFFVALVAGDATTVTADLDSVDILGALAAYPMTEGNGRQLRDLSGRYDALLSETGYQHLQPKSEGYVRVKGADATSAIYMLEASDIIPADSVITDIIAEERKVDVANTEQDLDDNRIRLNPSGSDLQIQRSDGTTHDTLGTVTAPTSLSDIDAEVHFKQQAR